MSTKYATVGDYWAQIGPKLEKIIEGSRDRDAEQLLEHATAVFSYAMEDIDQKRSQNQQIGHRLESGRPGRPTSR